MSTLAAIAAARDAEMRIDALSYRNRAMNLQVVAPDFTMIDTFSRELEQTRRFEVVLEANNPARRGNRGAAAHRRSQPMKTWFFGLEPRERWIVAIGARGRRRHHPVGIHRGAVACRAARLRASVNAKQRLLVDVARIEGEQPLSVEAIGRSRPNAQRHRRTDGYQPRPQSAADTRQWAERRRCDHSERVVRRARGLVVALHGTYGVDVETASFTSAREPGIVNGQLLLRRP